VCARVCRRTHSVYVCAHRLTLGITVTVRTYGTHSVACDHSRWCAQTRAHRHCTYAGAYRRRAHLLIDCSQAFLARSRSLHAPDDTLLPDIDARGATVLADDTHDTPATLHGSTTPVERVIARDSDKRDALSAFAHAHDNSTHAHDNGTRTTARTDARAHDAPVRTTSHAESATAARQHAHAHTLDDDECDDGLGHQHRSQSQVCVLCVWACALFACVTRCVRAGRPVVAAGVGLRSAAAAAVGGACGVVRRIDVIPVAGWVAVAGGVHRWHTGDACRTVSVVLSVHICVLCTYFTHSLMRDRSDAR
jgi:hypothetical protein